MTRRPGAPSLIALAAGYTLALGILVQGCASSGGRFDYSTLPPVNRAPSPVAEPAVAPSASAPNASVPPTPPAAPFALPSIAPQASGAELWRADATYPAEGIGNLVMPAARWRAAQWRELPLWGGDDIRTAWGAWMLSCQRPAENWRALCAQAQELNHASAAEQIAWLQTHLQPYRVLNAEGRAEGLLTGYYEPEFIAADRPQAPFLYPLYRTPPDLNTRKPYWSRAEMQGDARAQAAIAGLEIAWLADPVDALVLQIQGSGRLSLRQADGSVRQLRLAFAGHNGQPYKSVSTWLVEQREVAPRETSWEHVRKWAARRPERVNEMLAANPRVIFFRVTQDKIMPAGTSPTIAPAANDTDQDAIMQAAASLDNAQAGNAVPEAGPLGAQGLPLTAMRSIAVDPRAIPLGTPVWLASYSGNSTKSGDATKPGDAAGAELLARLVVAQDTGAAILGAPRADLFFGSGPEAETRAHRTRAPLRLWVLWPKTGTEATPR